MRQHTCVLVSALAFEESNVASIIVLARSICGMLLQEFDLDDSGSISQQELTDAMAMFEGPNRDPVT